MSIFKHDDFRKLLGLQDDMNRLFISAFTPNSGAADQMMKGGWNPLIDIYENQNQLIVEAELPGMNPEDVYISVENNVLTLQGERKFEKKAEGDNFHRVERSYGSFSRTFNLPPTVTSENATAEFQNGVLKLSLAKREEAKPRRIEITTSESGTKQINSNVKSAKA
ncbi:MAG TPA: Hsp20/alpha crystallin family protein [Pyrinomonadaceae bacterium]|nr:Hsp20/alpha crystallin family protein [Pyrinomonadaceae bacterium]